MQAILKRLFLLENANNCKLEITHVLIKDCHSDGFTVNLTLWDGVPGSGGEDIVTNVPDIKAAHACIDEITARYPKIQDFPIINLSFKEARKHMGVISAALDIV